MFLRIEQVWGPMLQPDMNASTSFILSFMDGSQKNKFIPRGSKTIIDVRDVAKAHVVAAEDVSVEGRVMLISHGVSWKDVCDELHRLRPDLRVIPFLFFLSSPFSSFPSVFCPSVLCTTGY